MVSFRDLVESMERDILHKEYEVVTYQEETCPPNTPDVPRSNKQEQIRQRKNNAISQVLKDVRQDHLEAKCDGKQTSGYKGAILEGTGREREPLSHARIEYVADKIPRHECRQLSLAGQGHLDNQHSLLVQSEDGECELQHDQQSLANQRESATVDQQLVSHQREFSNVNREFMAREYLYEHTNGKVVCSEHDLQRVVKEECSTVVKEEKKLDDSDHTVVEASVEHMPPLDPTEPVWMVPAHAVQCYQKPNLLTAYRPGMTHSKLQTTYATKPNHPRTSSTNSMASASTIAHSPRADIMHTRGTRTLTKTTNNPVNTFPANLSNTTGHRGDTHTTVPDDSSADGGRGQCWAGGGGDVPNPWHTSGTQRSRYTSGRSSQQPCVSAGSDEGFGTASVWGVTGLLSQTTQDTRGWRHLVPLRNCRSVKASRHAPNIRRCDRGDAGSTTTAGVGSREAGVEAGHTLGVSGPEHLTTHDTNDLSNKHRSRHSRGSKTSGMSKAGGQERQGSGATAGAAQQGTSPDTPVSHPPQSSSTFRCDVCETTRRDAQSLARHWRLHAPARPFACSDCSSRFNQLVHLQIHRRTHTGEKPFRCGTCGLRFSRKDRLRCHERRSHSGERPYPCPDCEATFRDVASLKVHLASHAPHHTPYTCRICHATFAQLSTFTSHWRRHSWGDNLRGNT